ncbi:putative Two-component sensor histidine kinase [Magnetospirillum sp. LM-5]|uniref:sensor histidine kinase n=1 Tax=Magnetospirillum sp. LM-5 TaxID=2681466 RepID=UPI00137DEDB2|nr:sensor histidine kinase [Magnetospirillum sp. LM-5]CAA7621247.1 putative Two-component sensor histidine kinase [Magnetospirillum sp. LM-5]
MAPAARFDGNNDNSPRPVRIGWAKEWPQSWRLVAICCATALPIAAFALVLGYFYADDRRKLIESEIDGIVTALSTAIERDIEARFQVLTVMASSTDIVRNDIGAFHRELTNVVRRPEQHWFTMALIDPVNKTMVTNTLRPYGAPLPYTSAPGNVARIVETKAPQIFGVVPSGSIQSKPLIIMGVPVMEGADIRYILNGTFFPAALSAVLTRQNFPATHVVAVIDANGRIAARSRDPDSFVGARITDSAGSKLAATTAQRGRFLALTQEGSEVVTTFHRIPGLGWTILYGVPKAVMQAPFEEADRILIPAAIVALLASALLVTLFIRADQRRRESEARVAAAAQEAEEQEYRMLQLAKQHAEETSQAKTDFLANMSHELRTPLNAILGFTEALQLEIFGPLQTAKQKEALRSVHHAGMLLKGSIDDMLDMAQIDTGKVALIDDEIDICELIKSCLATLMPLATSRSLRLDFAGTADAQIPKVRVDSLRFSQILVNLINNAIKFTPAGGLVTIDIDPTPDGWVRIMIHDTGIGIDSKDMDLVLQPFGRGSSPHVTKQEGNGLGLPLARRLVLLHDGTFHISSRPGAGTTVSIGIPPARVLRDG